MKFRFDRYLLKSFLSAAFFALLAFVVLFIVINMMEQLDDFIDKGASPVQIATYYLYYVPEITRLLIPVALLLASLFSVGKLATQNELTTMKASGMSVYRLILPILIASFAISLADVYFDAWVVPAANKQKFSFERRVLQRNVIAGVQDNIVFRESPTTMVSIQAFDPAHAVATNVSVDMFDANDPTIMTERYDSPLMRWDSVKSVWVLGSGMHRTFHSLHDSAWQVANLPLPFIRSGPEELRKRQMRPDEMNFGELKEFIDREQRSGRNVALTQVEYYGKIAFPFASVIVVLFGAVLASERRRSGIAVQIGIALGVSFLYIAISKLAQTIGASTDLPPVIIAWFTNIVFLAAGVVNLVRVQT
jgi:lipopolysaccharide export system permease protein